jgi:short-subunit dehydrogenase
MTNSSRPLAVVTGASSGIALELANAFASKGFDLIVTAQDADVELAAALLRGLGARVEVVRVDLGAAGGVDELYSYIKADGRPVAALVLNAGISARGAFATDTDLESELGLIDLNVRSTVHLARHVVRDMVARNEGRILFTSSIAATTPGSFQAVYNASKSFVQSFALALRNELKDTNVSITSLMPGAADADVTAWDGALR